MKLSPFWRKVLYLLAYLLTLSVFVWATYGIGWVKFIVACLSYGIAAHFHERYVAAKSA